MEDRETYDSLDEALMETFPASDPIAVDVVRPQQVEANDEWHHLLLRSRASASLAPRRQRSAPLPLAS